MTHIISKLQDSLAIQLDLNMALAERIRVLEAEVVLKDKKIKECKERLEVYKFNLKHSQNELKKAIGDKHCES